MFLRFMSVKRRKAVIIEGCLGLRFLAEAVEKVGWMVTLGFA
jgi:hypothetical protein